MLLLMEVQYFQKMIVDGIYCMAYDLQLAKIIQRSVQTNGD